MNKLCGRTGKRIELTLWTNYSGKGMQARLRAWEVGDTGI